MKALQRTAPRLLNHARCTSTRNFARAAADAKVQNTLSFSAAVGHVAELLVGGDKPVTTGHQASSSDSRRNAATLARRLQSRRTVSASEDATMRSNANTDNVMQSLRDSIVIPSQKKRKAKKVKKVAGTAAGTTANHSAVLAKPNNSTSNLGPSTSQPEMRLESSWLGDDWGKDTLAPPQIADSEDHKSSAQSRVTPPHMGPPIPYTRRLEGLLQDNAKPVLEDLVPPTDQRPIAKLAHGLDRVLFNPGVHWLQDPRSKVYNFSTWLESIPKVTDFAFERLAGFIKSSRDQDLWSLAKQEDRIFAGSTSSLTGMLCHIYFLISGDRGVDVSTLSRHFQQENTNFTPGQRMPSSVIMKYNHGVYAIDSDSQTPDEKNILTWLGHLMEKFLTTSPEDFATLMRKSPSIVKDEHDSRREAYRYGKSEKFVMRSQLDCVDARLPGTGVFDIKTRAALPIRMDLLNYEENSGYLIRSLHGPLESFEKEYYDLIRSAFLKYSFQARIGNMDGVFVAYHNTDRIFGFQYVSLDEMDERLFGATGRGNIIFERCVRLLETVVSEVILAFPEQSVKCTFEALDDSGFMRVWIEPAEWDETQGPRPIAQLDVTTTNYLQGQEVRGVRAISGAADGWTIHWCISKSSSSFEDIRYNFNEAKERQFRAYNLPSGVSLDKMVDRWNSMNFGGIESAPCEAAPYDPSWFQVADRNIRQLRRLARAGRADTEKMALENEGLAKVVWGEPEDCVEELERTDAAPLSEIEQEELSHASRYNSPAVVQTDVMDPELLVGSQDLTHPHEIEVGNQDGSLHDETGIEDRDIQISNLGSLMSDITSSSSRSVEALSGSHSKDLISILQSLPGGPPGVELASDEGPPMESVAVEGGERTVESSTVISAPSTSTPPESSESKQG